MTPEFKPFPKIPRLNRGMVVTEKLDGTNACVIVTEQGVYAQSRNRLITPDADNYGFARWVDENKFDLAEALGEGYHYGEWYGQGIQRGYGLDEKRFALFNTSRYEGVELPGRVEVVTTLAAADWDDSLIRQVVWGLKRTGSAHVEGFPDPEGVVVFHAASRQVYKVLCEADDIPKSLAA